MTNGDVPTMNLLVSPAWLAARLDDPNLAVLDATLPPVGAVPAVDTHARYLARHLPGAVFFDIEAFSDPASGLPHTLPSAERFARGMGALGLHEGMIFVVYEQAGVFSAPRAVWTLRTFGVREVYLLDGGLQAWIDAGLPTASGPVERAPTSSHARLDADAVVGFEQVQSLLAAGAQVLDARSAGRFAGTAPEPRPGLRSGHMPGAISVPYTDLVEAGRLKSPAELAALFQEKGVDLARPITTTCGSGITAAVVSLALELAGASRVTLYDGSWAEYAAHPQARIEHADLS